MLLCLLWDLKEMAHRKEICLFLSAQPERLHVAQLLLTELVSGQCLHKLNSCTWQMACVWCARSQCCVPTGVAGKGNPSERTAGGGCCFGEKAPGLAGGQSVQTLWPKPPWGAQPGARDNQWTSLGSEETGKVWCNPESQGAPQSHSYKQGSLSKGHNE